MWFNAIDTVTYSECLKCLFCHDTAVIGQHLLLVWIFVNILSQKKFSASSPFSFNTFDERITLLTLSTAFFIYKAVEIRKSSNNVLYTTHFYHLSVLVDGLLWKPWSCGIPICLFSFIGHFLPENLKTYFILFYISMAMGICSCVVSCQSETWLVITVVIGRWGRVLFWLHDKNGLPMDFQFYPQEMVMTGCVMPLGSEL